MPNIYSYPTNASLGYPYGIPGYGLLGPGPYPGSPEYRRLRGLTTPEPEPEPTPPITGPYAKYAVNASGADSDTISATLTRKQLQFFEKEVRPLEQRALDYLKDPNFADQIAALAGNRADEAVAALSGSTERMLSRYGVTPTQEQRTALDTIHGLNRALTIADAKNRTRYTARDKQIELAGKALQIGRNISQAATRDASSASQMASARKSAATAASSRSGGSSALSTVGTVVGIATGLAGIF